MSRVRVMTYNVHGCVGVDFRRSEERIAQVIGESGADIVGLQELDLGRRRSAGIDQAREIAAHLGFHYHFHPTIQRAEEQYGDALLCRWSMTVRRAGDLPSARAFPFRERRAAIWTECDTPLGNLQVINTHFGVGAGERSDQAAALLGGSWVGAVPADVPLVVLGDFNSPRRSAIYRRLAATLRDVSATDPRPTFPAGFAVTTLDYIFVNAAVQVGEVFVPKCGAARIASDHYPVIADLEFG